MKIYLAIPYAFNPEKSFSVANKMTAQLMQSGHVVFSPISHSHPVAEHLSGELKSSHDFWMQQDLPMVEWADELHVVCIGEMGSELIQNSKGVQSEIKHAIKHKKTIKVIDYYD